MDLDKLIKEAYLLEKNKDNGINKLYEMIETMLALQESGLLKEEVEEDIAVDLGDLEAILKQPPPAKDPAKQAAIAFNNLWKDRGAKLSLINDFKYKTDYYEEIRSKPHNKEPGKRVDQQDSAIATIRNFLVTADNIDPEILEYMKGFNDTVKGQIGYDAAVEKFKDSDGGGVPDSLERDNDTNPNNQNDDLEPYQTQDATEPEATPTVPSAEPEQAASITQPDIFRDSGTLSKIIETAIGEKVQNPQQLVSGLVKISSFSKTISEAEQKTQTLFKKNNAYNPENASKLILLDYINSMVSEYESTVGGYGFEYLLAALAGGQQAGTQTTSDGKMGAVDFTFGDGTYGSSKLYTNFENIKQAVSGFKEEKVGKKVLYIIAIREKGDDKTLAINLYSFYIKLNNPEPKQINKRNIDKILKQIKNLNAYVGAKKGDGKLMVGDKEYTHYYDFTIGSNGKYPVLTRKKDDSSFIPTDVKFNKTTIKKVIGEGTGRTSKINKITFYKTETSSFREQLNQSYEENSVRLIQVLSDIIQNIKNTKKETETYFATGNINDGINAFSAVYKTEKGLEEMAGSISGNEESVEAAKTRAKTENT